MNDDRTPNLGLPLPHPDNALSEDVVRLRDALSGLDAAITQYSQALSIAVDGLNSALSGLDAVVTDHRHESLYQPLDAELTALAGLASRADTIPYFTGAESAALATLSAFGRSLIANAGAESARATLGVKVGIDVQAYSSGIPTTPASQAEMEAGAESSLRSMSPIRVRQAIEALTSNLAILNLGYESRGDLRSNETSRYALVDSLGLFAWISGSSEPDDDESCFATENGRWLLAAVHWDAVYSLTLALESRQNARLSGIEARWPGRILFGSAWSGITRIGANSQVSLTAQVPGVEMGDRVIAAPDYGLSQFFFFHARATGKNTVTIYINNYSDFSRSISTGVWRLVVIQEI